MAQEKSVTNNNQVVYPFGVGKFSNSGHDTIENNYTESSHKHSSDDKHPQSEIMKSEKQLGLESDVINTSNEIASMKKAEDKMQHLYDTFSGRIREIYKTLKKKEQSDLRKYDTLMISSMFSNEMANEDSKNNDDAIPDVVNDDTEGGTSVTAAAEAAAAAADQSIQGSINVQNGHGFFIPESVTKEMLSAKLKELEDACADISAQMINNNYHMQQKQRRLQQANQKLFELKKLTNQQW